MEIARGWGSKAPDSPTRECSLLLCHLENRPVKKQDSKGILPVSKRALFSANKSKRPELNSCSSRL